MGSNQTMTTAQVVEHVVDTRPDPVMPAELYVVLYFIWLAPESFRPKGQWIPIVSATDKTLDAARTEAQKHAAKGHRGVRILHIALAEQDEKKGFANG